MLLVKLLLLLQLMHEDTNAKPSALEKMTLNATTKSRDIGKNPIRKRASNIMVALFFPDAVLPGPRRQWASPAAGIPHPLREIRVRCGANSAREFVIL